MSGGLGEKLVSWLEKEQKRDKPHSQQTPHQQSFFFFFSMTQTTARELL